MSAPSQEEFSRLPAIDRLLDAAADLIQRYGHRRVTEALRRVVDEARERVLAGAGATSDEADLVAAAAVLLAGRTPGPPRAVLNAAGVVVHTNLGRAPLSAEAITAVTEAAGYCDLEYDLAEGIRSSRLARLEPLLVDATGAEAGIAVNNAAGALVLVLAALAGDRDVLVSRGELVEIGGSFRLPEIMAASQARLVEVGTTNRTRVADYQRPGDVALILKVHPSNYRISGFTAQPTVAELAAVARERGVPLVHDVGSGLLTDRDEPLTAAEPSVAGSLAAGADLVLCSGDKLLAGPQAGLLVGRADLVTACRTHPLARALRLDKLRIAALVATLEAHLRGDLASLPVWQALLADEDDLAERAAALAARTGGSVEAGHTVVGGGAAPDRKLDSPVVKISCPNAEAVAARLRAGEPPIVVRIADGALWVDVRTVPATADDLLAERLAAALHDT